MKNIPLVLSVAFFTFLIFRQVQGQKNMLYFPKNCYQLNAKSHQVLDSICLTIIDPKEEIALIGFTDSDANEAYNEQLSLLRAREVQNYLKQKSIANRIHIEYHGESKPVNTNKNEGEKSLNRRVEIIRNYQPEKQFTENVKKKEQVFTINTNKDTLLICAEGTTIRIPSNSFDRENNTKEVTLKVTEFYSKKDFLLNNLTTMDIDGRHLISGGMLHISAFHDQKPVELKSDAHLELGFKNKQKNDEMQTFYGSPGATVMKWTTNPNLDKTDNSPILTSMYWKIRNMDTMEITQHFQQFVNGKNCEIKKRTYRNHPKAEFQTQIDTSVIDDRTFISETLLSTSKLGWINCDKFSKPQEPVVPQFVKYEGAETPFVLLVFKDINSILPYSTRENNSCIFDKIPVGQKFDVIGLSFDKDVILYSRLKDQVAGEKPFELKLEPLQKEEVIHELADLE